MYKQRLIAALALTGMCAVLPGAAAATLRFKVMVTVKESPSDPAKPFPNVSGFTIKRSLVDVADAQCPDPSNEKGVLECTVTCNVNDPNPKFVVHSPVREKYRIVAGYGIRPNTALVDVKSCAIAKDLVLVFAYKSTDVMLAELQSTSPDVFRAVVASTAPGPGSNVHGRFKVRALSESAGALTDLAKNDANQAGLNALGEIATIRNEALSGNARTSDALSSYSVGTKSAIIRAATLETSWKDASQLAKVTPDPVIFEKDVAAIELELNKKKVLNVNEQKLDRTIRTMKMGF